MSYARQRKREGYEKRWRDCLIQLLAETRDALGLRADEVVPDEVLIAEADHHFGRSGTNRPHAWFNSRLSGVANTETERADLKARLDSLSAGPVPFGVNALLRPPRR